MKFYRLNPEVAGGWGPNTEFTRVPGKPEVMHKLHYQFDGWLGDELLESVACFIVTQRLAEELESCDLSGYELKSVEISASEQFFDLYPGRELPEFLWLDVNGTAGADDFGVDDSRNLVVSEDALSILQKTQLNNCNISPA